MRPRVIEDEGVARVLLRNRSPNAQTASLTIDTPKGGLYVDTPQKQITLVTGQQGVVDFYLQPMKKPFIGRQRSWPYIVRVAPSIPQGQPPPAMDGQVVVRPQIPPWLGILLLLSLVALCVLSFWLLSALPVFDGL